MNVVIIEDENLTARRLEGQLKKYDPTIEVLERLPSVKRAVEWFQTHSAPDLVFMDIHLEDNLGFAIFDQVQLQAPVIFTTAYDEYMIKAFKVNSIDYLLKPVNYEELVGAVEKFKALRQQYAQQSTQAQPDLSALLSFVNKSKEPEYKHRFMVTVGPKIRSIEASDIAYFFLEEKIAFLVTAEGQTLPVDYSLDKLAQMLDPRRFFRISRQFIVSLPAIRQIYSYSAGKLKLELQPKPRHEVFVSGDRMGDFKEWLGK